MTNLKLIRTSKNLTRFELSKKSGVSARTIEGYEQGLKNINNAPVTNVLKLANALNCKIEDILN